MDNLTHTAIGLFLSRAGLNRWTPAATPILLLAANAPDIDIVTLSGGSLNYLHYHRHLTHSLIAMPVRLVDRDVDRALVPVCKILRERPCEPEADPGSGAGNDRDFPGECLHQVTCNRCCSVGNKRNRPPPPRFTRPKGDRTMSMLASFWSSPAFTEYFKDYTLGILVLIFIAVWFFGRKRIIADPPPDSRPPRA